ATERIVNVHDVDARKGKKTTVVWDGRKLAVNVTDASYFIVAATSAPANDNDGELLLPLLDQEKEHFALVPPELTVDKAADLDPLLEQIAARGNLAHIPVAPAPNAHGITLFDADDFIFNPEHNTLTCPAGHTAANARADSFGTRDGAKFTFSRPVC